MSEQDHKAQSGVSARLLAVGLVAILLAALLLVVLLTRKDGRVEGATLPSSSTATIPTTTRLDTRTELTGRLVEILKIRDRAFQDRDSEILKDVYTDDCPCLEGDQNAIQELIENDYRMIGGATSIRLHRVSKASERLWLIIADFRSAPLQIKGKDGRLIREEPAGSELFQFALSKPNGSAEWLLGRATAYRDRTG
jgi:hypothetical protein